MELSITLMLPPVGFFHAHGVGYAAGHQAMLLIFDRTRAYRQVRKQVIEHLIVGRIQHLVSGKQPRLFNHAQMHMTNSFDAFEQVIAR